jgi:hypothetical protein
VRLLFITTNGLPAVKIFDFGILGNRSFDGVNKVVLRNFEQYESSHFRGRSGNQDCRRNGNKAKADGQHRGQADIVAYHEDL